MRHDEWPDQAFWEEAWVRAERTAYAVLNDAYQSQDVAQQTCERVYERRASLVPETAQAYVAVIARNLARDLLRQRRPLTPFDEQGPPGPATPVADEHDQTIAKLAREAAFEALPTDRSRTIATLFFIRGVKYEEIAEIVGLSYGTVRNEVVSIRRFLKEYLNEEFSDGE
jgi:RNA polymerase sigma factor (sigma-70 family)